MYLESNVYAYTRKQYRIDTLEINNKQKNLWHIAKFFKEEAKGRKKLRTQ